MPEHTETTLASPGEGLPEGLPDPAAAAADSPAASDNTGLGSAPPEPEATATDAGSDKRTDVGADAAEASAPAAATAAADEDTAAEQAEPAAAAADADADATSDAVPSGQAAIPELSPAACAAKLAELFPALFSPSSPKPLKLRIQADIQQRAPGTFTRKSLSIFLHRHTTSTAYLKALANAQDRIDLDGQPAGAVADEHREAAAAELLRRRELHDARRAAEREAQRQQRQAERRPGRGAAQAAAGTAPPGSEAPAGQGEDQAAAAQAPGRPDPRPSRPAKRQTSRDTPRQAKPQQPTEAERQAQQARQAERDARRQAEREAQRQAQEAAYLNNEAEGQGRADRAALLRSFESSTLTKANFCVLKRIPETELDGLLAQARQEREQRLQALPHRDRRPGPRRPQQGGSQT